MSAKTLGDYSLPLLLSRRKPLNKDQWTDYCFPDKIPLLRVRRRGDSAMEDKKMPEDTSNSVSRRNFIRGAIAAGAVASSSAYLFRSATLHGQPAAGAVERLLTLNVNGQNRRVDVMPQET